MEMKFDKIFTIFEENIFNRFLFRLSELSFAKIIVLGLVPRLFLMPFVAHPFDVNAWYIDCLGFIEGNFGVLASDRPLWFLTLIPIAYLYNFLSPIIGFRAIPIEMLPPQMNPQFGAQYVTDPLFNFLVKLPMLVTDIATALVLYKMVAQFADNSVPKKMLVLFYFNPIAIWISAGWGQYESIPAFFLILSLYLLLKERIFPSALSALIATLYKAYPVLFVMPITAYLAKRADKTGLVKYCFAFSAPLLLALIMGGAAMTEKFYSFFLGFFSTESFFGLFGYGLTYWSISMLYPLDSNIWMHVPNILVTVSLLATSFFALKAKFIDSLRDITLIFFMLLSAIFLSYRYVGETRFLLLSPFLILMVAKKTVSGKSYALLSAVAFLYTQKNFPYYLLPIASVNKEFLVPLFTLSKPFGTIAQNALIPTTPGAIILAALGTMFSILLAKIYMYAQKALNSY